jgi:hypothetical protein
MTVDRSHRKVLVTFGRYRMHGASMAETPFKVSIGMDPLAF